MIADKLRRLTAFLTALVLSFAAAVTASAAKKSTEPTEYDVTDKNAERVIADFVEEYAVNSDTVAVGYKNLVTGETALFHEDYFAFEASLYKLPLNMYWAEKVYEGEITMDEPVGNNTLEYVQRRSLVNSNNPLSERLVEKIGSFSDFRRIAGRFYGMTEEEIEEPDYLKKRTNCVSRLLCCLEMLYDEPERYPGVLECMMEAQPTEFFRTFEDRFPIAQKYGSVADFSVSFPVNAAGILYTDDPFLLVVLSEQKSLSSKTIGILAQRLCDYTQLSREARIEREKEEAEAKRRSFELAERERLAEEAERQAAEAAEAGKTAAAAAALAQQSAERKRKETAAHGGILWAGFAVSLLALTLIFRKKDKEE